MTPDTAIVCKPFADLAKGARGPVTPETQAEFDCAVRHVIDAFGLPRFQADEVALRILMLTQTGWSPFPCPHPAKHDRRLRKVVAWVCVGYCKAMLRPGPQYDEIVHGTDFCFICGGRLEPRFDEPAPSENRGPFLNGPEALAEASAQKQVVSE